MSTADASAKIESTSATALGKYRMVARLGVGGMAEVYLAVARGAMNVNRLVVVKRLRDEQASDEPSREMFLNEARLAARLNHANVIQTFEAGSENGIYFLAMEFVDGQPLSRLLSRLKKADRLIDPSLAARLCADALNGLHYAHELADFDGTPLEIVHRDVSPQNVMLTYDGVVKLVDFGIAKAAGSTQTAHGVFKGKVAYMAPEQVVADRVDRRADIFAAGVVLWEALTGERLIAAESAAKTLYNLLNKPLPRASQFRPDLPAALDDVVAKALERDVDKRFPTAKAMREALESCITGTSGSNTALGVLVTELFGSTRAKVQEQIKAQLATLSLGRASDPMIEASEDVSRTHVRPSTMLIDLSDAMVTTDPNLSASLFRVRTNNENVLTGSAQVAAKKSSRLPWALVAVMLVGAGGYAYRVRLAPAAMATTSPTVAAAPPPPIAATDAPPAHPSAALPASSTALRAPAAEPSSEPTPQPSTAVKATPAPIRHASPVPARPAAPPAASGAPVAAPPTSAGIVPTAPPAETSTGRTFRRNL